MPSIKFDAVIETGKVLAGIQAIKDAVRETSSQVKRDGDSIDAVVSKIKDGAMAIAGSWTASQLVNKIMQVRGEFQQLEIAFNTMLGSEQKASELMNQLVHTAAITPFDLQGVANGAKQLLAYGTSADEVNDILVHLGDIAAGLSLPLNDLVYLYGTTMAQGRMFSMDLRQFMGRGIPLAQELAKQFGVTENKVSDLVSAGKVGAAEFKKAIMSLSSEGGKFGGLMEAQSKSITGQISNIEDAIDVMFNDIGKQNEGVINLALSGVSSMVENYERVGKNLMALVATYGAYKTALIAVDATHKLLTVTETGSIALTVSHTAALRKMVAVRQMLNSAMAKAPYVAVAAAVASLAFYLANVKSMQEKVNDAYNQYNDEKTKALDLEKKHQAKIEELINVANNEQASTEDRRLALVRLEQQYPSIFAKYDSEQKKLSNILTIKQEIAELDGKTSLSNAEFELDTVNKKIAKLQAEEATEVNVTMQSTIGAVGSKQLGGLSFDEKAELKALQKRKAELQKSIKKEAGDRYLSDLTGVSDEEIDKQIQQRQRVLAKMAVTGKKYGKITIGGVTGVYSEDELRGQLNILETAKKDNKNAVTPAQQKAKLKKDLDDAKKALADFDKSTKKMTGAKAEEQRAKLVSSVETAEKSYKAFGGKVKTEQSLASEANKRTNAQADLDEKLLSLQQKNADDELAIQKDSTEKKLKEIENDYKKREAEIDKQEKEFKKKNKEAGKKENLTEEQKTAITTARDLNTKERDKKKTDLTKEQQEAELASRIAFLSEYGTLEQKKVAATEEANEKIRKINEDGTLTSTDKDYQIKSIKAGLQQSLNDLNLEDLKKNLDWDYIFSDMEKGTPEVLEHVKEQLEEFKNTAKDLTPEQIKTVTDALTELQDKMDLSTPIETIKTARTEYQKAKEAYDQYSQQYEEAKASGDTKGMDEAYKGMIAEGKKMDKANNKSKKSTEQLASTVNELGSALSGLGDQIDGTEGKVLSLAGSCVTSFGGILSGIKAVKSATDTLSKTVAVLAIIQAAFTAINAVLSAIGGEDTSLTEYVNTMDRYIYLLSDSISDLNESMTDAKNTMADTLAIYQELKQTREDEADVIKSQSKAWLSSGAGMFSSSEGIKITNAITDTLKHGDDTTNEGFQSLLDWWEKSTGETANERLRNLKGIGSTIWNWDIKDTLGRNDWIWNLSDEDLIALSKDQKVMALLGDTLSDAIKKYVDAKEALADDADALGESLLNISWDSFYDDFVNMVEDMDNTSADFANNFAEYMRNALVKNLVASKYKGQLEKLYEAIVGSAKDGTLEDKMNDYKNQYSNLAQSMQDDVEAINQVTGYTDSTSQSATAGGWETMGQETAEELNGRFTALQIAGESIANNMADTVAQMQSIVEVGISTNGAVLDIRNLMVMTNSYLEDMVKYSKLTYTDFGTKLDAVYTRLKEI